jgi:hypothetical protein
MSDDQTHYILIDFENVHVKSLALLKEKNFRVRVFLGPKNSRLPTELVLTMKSLGDHADYIVLDAGGHNALDFHITYYLGRLAAADPAGFFHLISKDTGFDSLIRHMSAAGILCERSVSIESIPCLANTSTKSESSQTEITNPAKGHAKKKAPQLVEHVLTNLIKRKSALPRLEKTLRSTMKAICGAQYSEKEIEAVLNRLIKKKYVAVDGTRVSYTLPAVDSGPVT